MFVCIMKGLNWTSELFCEQERELELNQLPFNPIRENALLKRSSSDSSLTQVGLIVYLFSFELNNTFIGSSVKTKNICSHFH